MKHNLVIKKFQIESEVNVISWFFFFPSRQIEFLWNWFYSPKRAFARILKYSVVSKYRVYDFLIILSFAFDILTV